MDPPFGGRRSKKDQEIAILKLFDHRERERGSRAIPIGARASKNILNNMSSFHSSLMT